MTEAAALDTLSRSEHSRRKAWAWRLGGLAVSIVALAIVFGTVDVRAARAVLSGASLSLVAAALGVVAVQVVVRGWRWRIVLPPEPSGEPVPLLRTISPLLIGYLGNAVLPARLGEPIRATHFFLVARSLGIGLGYPGAVLIGAVAVLATAIPAAPGYVGTFEVAAVATAVAMGVRRAEALALAILVRIITVVPVALAGAAALVATGTGLGRLAQEAEAGPASSHDGAAA